MDGSCAHVYLLQHAGSELHGLMVLLLQHVHVEVIQKVVPVIIHPALIQLLLDRRHVQLDAHQNAGCAKYKYYQHLMAEVGQASSLLPGSLAGPPAGRYSGSPLWSAGPQHLLCSGSLHR